MKILDIHHTPISEVIATTTTVLAAGGLVIFPTETTYGAGVDATIQAAVDKLLRYKSRREGKPLSIAVPDLPTAEKYVSLNEQARKLYLQFLPGPVTVVSRSLGTVADGVASEFGTLGVRIPDYPLLLEILKAYGQPITATSANASGEKRPYSVTDILDGLSEKQKSLIDLVLDAGTLPPNEPSTVIDTTLSTPTTLREGAVSKQNPSSPRLTLVSASEAETKGIAGRLMLKHWNDIKERGVVIGLDGPLGAGKTIFTKGVAEFLGIRETITSPTYSYIEEYEWLRQGVAGQLFHLDLWKTEDVTHVERLEIEQQLAPHTVTVIEWWSQADEYLHQLARKLQVALFTVKIEELDNGARELKIWESH